MIMMTILTMILMTRMISILLLVVLVGIVSLVSQSSYQRCRSGCWAAGPDAGEQAASVMEATSNAKEMAVPTTFTVVFV